MPKAVPARAPDEQALQVILAYYRDGLSYEDAAAQAHVDPETALAWKRLPLFAQELVYARSSGIYDLIQGIKSVAEDPKGRDWKALAWLLERLAPGQFAPPQVLAQSLTVNHVQNQVVLTNERQESIARLVAKIQLENKAIDLTEPE